MEEQTFFDYLNHQNNMDLKKIVVFVSKFSDVCKQFLSALHPLYKDIILCVSVDNRQVRERLAKSKFKVTVVPTVFMLFKNGTVNVHIGKQLVPLVDFLNKSIETFLIVQSHMTSPKVSSSIISSLPSTSSTSSTSSTTSTSPTSPHSSNSSNSSTSNVTHLFGNEPDDIENKSSFGIQSAKSSQFERTIDIGPKENIVQRGKGLENVARSSLLMVSPQNDQVSSLIKHDENDSSIPLQTDSAELLEEDIEEMLNADATLDPLIQKSLSEDKNNNKWESVKRIANDMAQLRENEERSMSNQQTKL
jgi:hypothetical protein